MKDMAARLAERGVALAVSDAALDVVLAQSYDPVSNLNCYPLSVCAAVCDSLWRCWFSIYVIQVYGARPIRRWLEKNVVTELSMMLIKDEIDENSTVYIDASPGAKGLTYRVEKNGGLVNADTGLKSDILIEIPNGPSKSEAAQMVKKMKILEEEDDMEE